MGTHPIFESDFDCLTEMTRPAKRQRLVISGSSHPELGELIAKKLSTQLGKCKMTKMSNGETHVDIQDSVRNKVVYVIQSVGENVNDALFEMQLLGYACKTASAHSIIGVLPYLPYSRQCKMRKRGSIVAKLMAQNLSKAGFCHIITLDLHQKEIQGFFECPVDNLRASPYLLRELSEFPEYNSNLVVVSRNPGHAKRAQSFAERLRVKLAVIHGEGIHKDEQQEDGRSSPPPPGGPSSPSNEPLKVTFGDDLVRKRSESDFSPKMQRERTTSNPANPSKRTRTISSTIGTGTQLNYVDLPMLIEKAKPPLHVVGDIESKTCIIVEDMLHEAKPFIECATYLKANGAKNVIIMVTHAIFYGDTIQLIEKSCIDHVITSNSVNFQDHLKDASKIRVVDISILLSEAIRRIHFGESMSYMFKDVPFED